MPAGPVPRHGPRSAAAEFKRRFKRRRGKVMAAQWFCQMAGAEVGPLSSQQVKMMVANGRLCRATRSGKDPAGRGSRQPASRVSFRPCSRRRSHPREAIRPRRRTVVPCPWRRKPPRPSPRPTRRKKPAGGQPGTVRAAKPIVVPARQAQQPAPAQESGNGDFPEELAGGIPKPKKGFNFDRLAIDTTPVKVTGRKTSRVGGMNKNERTKVMRIMAGGIGGALLLSAIMMLIYFIGHRNAPKRAAGCHGIAIRRIPMPATPPRRRRRRPRRMRRTSRRPRTSPPQSPARPPRGPQRGRGRTSGILEIQGHHQNGPEKRRLILTSPWVPISRPEFVGNHEQP